MSVQVTIDTMSKCDAEIIAAALPGAAEAKSWRGYGVIRLRVRNDREARELIPVVGECVEDNDLAWARVRISDDERVFRGRRQRSFKTGASSNSPGHMGGPTYERGAGQSIRLRSTVTPCEE